jgi:hypothetical protein
MGSELTVLDTQNQVTEPIPTIILGAWLSPLVKANLHDDALLTHLQHHVQRVLVRVIEHLDQLHQVRVVELLHDGNLLPDQVQSVLGLEGVMLTELPLMRSPWRSPRAARELPRA